MSELLPSFVDVIHMPFVVPTPAGPIAREVYAFAVHGEAVTVIDTGVAGAEKTILPVVKARGKQASDIRLAVLTHAHPDHVGGARIAQNDPMGTARSR